MIRPAYYNEIDPYAAQWLRNLIAAGQIAHGDVDERSITEVRPDDLHGYTQCHFFAGIGGWSLALRLAGWPDDRPAWTGSCPCQPFSVAGAQRGSRDERHLWPAFFDLIRERRPASVFGEQVAGAAGLAWLDHVLFDLEGAGYAAAAADLPACSVGAPHKRQRLFWVAAAEYTKRRTLDVAGKDGRNGAHCGRQEAHGIVGTCGEVRSMADPDGRNPGTERQQRGRQQRLEPQDGGIGFMGHADPQRPSGRGDTGSGAGLGEPWAQPAGAGADDGVDNAIGTRLEGHRPDQGQGGWFGATGSVAEAGPLDPWRTLEWIACSDGKARPTQPGLSPLVDGVSDGRVAIGRAIPQSIAALSEAEAAHRFNRTGTLRGAGNAIVPQVAAAFVMACQP